MEITKERLQLLKEWLDSKPEINGQPYVGFFWGESTEDQWKQTREELIPLLEDLISNNEKVYYGSWW